MLVKDFSKVKAMSIKLNSDHLWSDIFALRGPKGNHFSFGETRGEIWSQLLSQLCCSGAALDQSLVLSAHFSISKMKVKRVIQTIYEEHPGQHMVSEKLSIVGRLFL